MTATAAVGTHPTGMYSCFILFLRKERFFLILARRVCSAAMDFEANRGFKTRADFRTVCTNRIGKTSLKFFLEMLYRYGW